MIRILLRTKHLKQIIFFVVVAAVSVGLTLFIVDRNKDSARELSKVIKSVEAHMILPEGETPTLAVVKDKDLLQDKTLKTLAQNGDEILLFTNAGQAIIYRPSIDKIVAVKNVTVDAAQAQAKDSTIKILSGTGSALGVEKLAKDVSEKYPTAKVTTGSANRKDYAKTIVIDTNDKKDDLFVQLLDFVQGHRGVIPLGEAKSDSDITIIVGQDYLDRIQL